MSEKRYHLFRDFGIYKVTLKRNFYDNDRGPEYDDVEELLRRRTQFYTLPEIDRLSGFFLTAHDECVLENPDDYSGLEVYKATRKNETASGAFKRLVELGQWKL